VRARAGQRGDHDNSAGTYARDDAQDVNRTAALNTAALDRTDHSRPHAASPIANGYHQPERCSDEHPDPTDAEVPHARSALLTHDDADDG
jgi:hypothetical protein